MCGREIGAEACVTTRSRAVRFGQGAQREEAAKKALQCELRREVSFEFSLD